ncbi:MAG: DUF4397 domain-containing protein [Planctomycetes bacterium]|jgi:hypothetical protein|nr:DUF4397 domain-containing protein [Planctomycetota bacterium]
MKTLLPTTLTMLLVATSATAQNTDFSFAHGIPGLPAAVEVAVDGITIFSGVNFGDLQSTTIAPGPHTIEVRNGTTVLLSATTTTGADQSVTAAAHLLDGGAADLAVFQNDLEAVTFIGDGRFTVRHLADAGPALVGIRSSSYLGLSGLANGAQFPAEIGAGTYDLDVAEFGLGSPFPFPPSAQVAQGLNLAADRGVIAHVVGVPGTPSFSVIVQNVTLAPATPINPSACDLALSGSLVGGSIGAGGDITYALTGASPNSFVAVFLALDNSPFTFFSFPLSIGGGGGLFVATFGLADGNGNFAQTLTYPASPVTGSGPTSFWNLFAQAASADFAPAGFLPTCLSDVEPLQISIQ